MLLIDEWHADSTFEHQLGGGIRLTTRRVNRIRSGSLLCLCVHVDRLDFCSQPPTTSTETILIPKYHAKHMADHEELLLTMTGCSVPVPDETGTLTYYGVTSWGRLAPRDYYVSKKSLGQNEPETMLTPDYDSYEVSSDEGEEEEEGDYESDCSASHMTARSSTSSSLPDIPIASDDELFDCAFRRQGRVEAAHYEFLITPFSSQHKRGPHCVTEFVSKRPEIYSVCHYLIYRSFEYHISQNGEFPYVMDTVESVRGLLLSHGDSLKQCIDTTLDECGYNMNRITHRGLANLILRQDDESPQGRALYELNNPAEIPDFEKLMEERVLRAMFNHVLRLKISSM